MDGFEGVAALAGGNAVNLLDDVLRTGFTSFGRAMHARTRETLTHTFYSQLPYALGSEQAAKISLVSRQTTCGDRGADDVCCLPSRTQPRSEEEALSFARDRSKVTAEYLARCDAVFDLKLQVKRYGSRWFTNHTDIIEHKASVSWGEDEVTVGSLRIPRQQCTNDIAAGVRLVSALSRELQIPSEAIDKVFNFHPVSTHEDNKPVGDVNVFRSAFYMQHSAMRRDTMQAGVFAESSRSFQQSPANVPRMPFDALRAANVFEAQPSSLADLHRPRFSKGHIAGGV